MKKIVVIANMLFSLGTTFGVGVCDAGSSQVENRNLSRIFEESSPTSFLDLSGEQKVKFIRLMQSIWEDNIDSVKNVIDRDCSVINVEDDCGHTPLILSLLRKRDDIAKYLVEHGADVNQTNRWGVVPLLSAKSSEMIGYLVQHGINLRYKNETKDTLLHLAVQSGEEHLTRRLVEEGLDINKKNIFDETPLFFAVQRKEKKIIKYLTEKGARVSTKDNIAAQVNYQLALDRFLKLSHTSSEGVEAYRSEEVKVCREIIKILARYSDLNYLR